MAKPKGAINRAPSKAEREKSAIVDAKQKVFADAVMEGHSQSDAARAAGYHPASAASVMRQEEIQGYLAEARREVRDLTTVRRLDVLNIFMEAIDMARTMSDPAQMINGAKEVGKMMGFYEPETLKLEVEGNTRSLSAKFKALTDSQLLEIAAGRATVIDGEVVE